MKSFSKPSPRTMSALVIVLHLVGVAGFVYEPTRWLFLALVPANLLLNIAMLALFHEGRSYRITVLLSAIALLGFLAEALGVNTGWVFGHYAYSPALGFQVLDTPLMIGLLWAMLIYLFVVVLGSLRGWQFVLAGALSMTLFDVVMEPGAVSIGLWSWSDGTVPWLNYATWFGLSVLMLMMMGGQAGQIKNRLALTILLSQLLFFKALWVLM